MFNGGLSDRRCLLNTMMYALLLMAVPVNFKLIIVSTGASMIQWSTSTFAKTVVSRSMLIVAQLLMGMITAGLQEWWLDMRFS